MTSRAAERKGANEPAQIPADRVRSGLGDLLDRAGWQGEQIVITRHGKPVAALVGLPDLERLRSLDAA